jgi:hypothetical protein
MTEKPRTRLVDPKSWAIIAATGLAATAPLALMVHAGSSHAAGASESGEAGEAGVVLSEGPSAFLTKLGYFEGTYRIIAALYLGGNRALAREHMELSHHAFYEDIEPALAEYGAPGFAAENTAFITAILADADADVAAAFDALLAALGRSAAATPAKARDRLMSLRDLMALAAAEYEGGVTDGQVELDMEYRDSWGFYETARKRAEALVANTDPSLSKAGSEVLEQLAGLDTLYPSLTSQTGAADPSPLAAAAAWIEIIALRQR